MFIQEYLRGLQQNTLSNTEITKGSQVQLMGSLHLKFKSITINAIILLESASVLACTWTSDVLLVFKVTLL